MTCDRNRRKNQISVSFVSPSTIAKAKGNMFRLPSWPIAVSKVLWYFLVKKCSVNLDYWLVVIKVINARLESPKYTFEHVTRFILNTVYNKRPSYIFDNCPRETFLNRLQPSWKMIIGFIPYGKRLLFCHPCFFIRYRITIMTFFLQLNFS